MENSHWFGARPAAAGRLRQLQSAEAATRSGFDDDLEAAIDHALGIEGHLVRITHALETPISHHLLEDAIALGARLVGDPGEDDRLAGLLLHAARKGRDLALGDVVGETFLVVERSMVTPDLARESGELLVLLEVLLRNGNDETIDIGHDRISYGWTIARANPAKAEYFGDKDLDQNMDLART